MILTTLLLMQGQVLAPAETGEEGRGILPNLFSVDTDLHLFGRFQQDFAYIDDDNGPTRTKDGSEVRRARLGASGNLAEGLDWMMELDFASFDGGGAAFTDAYLEFSNLPVGTLRVGHFKEPFSLNELTSSRFITFTERADTFAPSRNVGVMLSDHNENLTWQAGAFWEAGTTGNLATENDTALTGRVVFRPYMEDGGKRLAHVGIAISLREVDNGTSSYAASSNGGIHLLNKDVAFATIAADDGLTKIGLEAAIQEGPISGQLEFVQADGDDDSVTAWYLQGGYFLTGESRGYDASNAVWDRVKPNTPYGQNGNGAWEVAGRIGAIDLSEAAANAEATTIAIALNWYMTSYTRVGFDIYSTDSDALAEDVMGAVIRFGFDF
jgi:phosphate-selective porin OprO and OprP